MNYFVFRNQMIAYRDQGKGEILLIVHGTPTSSEEYADVIGELSSQFRCIAIDHLGFGASDKPKNGDYSLCAHQERLAALVEHLKIHSFHLLVHDFGGVIGLPLVNYSNYQIQSVTILNSWLWPISETQPDSGEQKWLLNTGLFPFLYRYLNFSARFLIPMAWGTRKPLSKERHAQYIEAFPSRYHREGPVAFAEALFDFSNSIWQQKKTLETLQHLPIQIVWGTSDKLIRIENLYRWKQELPQAHVHKLLGVGHFVADEAASEVSRIVLQNIVRNSK